MKALIFGIGGQDGAYLSKLLLSKGYSIFGTSRGLKLSHFPNLIKLDIKDNIKLFTLDIRDPKSVLKYIDMIKPHEIYNLSGQTSVSLSFQQPFETMESIAKATAHYLVKKYREAYSLYASTGFLFYHEAPLRPQHFVTQKIISTAARINAGHKERLKLGNLSISRDWGWAPDYVDAIWRILRQSSLDDFIIATGKTTSLQQFVEKSFSFFNLNWEDYVDIDRNLMRPCDIQINCGNANKSKKMLGWTSTKNIDEIISALCTSAKEIYK